MPCAKCTQLGDTSCSPGWHTGNMQTYTLPPNGRGPTGRLRNFTAMSDYKLARTLGQMQRNSHGDLVALAACRAAAAARNLTALTAGLVPARSH